MSFSSCSLKHIALLAASLTPVLFMTGCTMSTTAPATNSFSSAAVLSGSLHGGNQPITSAIITLYEAGSGDYGTAGTAVAQTTSNPDASASFSFTQNAVDPTNPTGIISATGSVYSCPTVGDPQMYIVAKGGNTTPTGANNSAAFIAAIGDCQNAASKFVNMNEITTVATLAALQQYFNPNSESFGYPATAQAATGFVNGVATIANLANYSDGSTVTTKTLTGSASTVNGTAVTVTPESAKINTIADVLAACVNTVSNVVTTSPNCQTLFDNAVQPASNAVTSQPNQTFSKATDTLQAAYFMLVNPTESLDNGTTSGKMFNLYTLAGGVGAPFQPALTAQPTDWTIGILYSGTAGSPAVATTCTGTATGKFLYYAYLVRADANGNIWMSDNNTTTAGNVDNISEISPTGVPLACVSPTTTAEAGFQGLTIDTAGNIWAAGHSVAGVYEINPSNLAVTNWTEASIIPADIQADGSGNVFYSVNGAAVRKFASAATTPTPFAATAIGTASDAVQTYMVLNPSGDIFVADNTGGATGTLYETYPNAGGTNGYSTYVAGTSGNVQAQIAVDTSGRVWTTQTTPANSAIVLTPATPPALATATTIATGTGGLSTPRGVAIDGAGNAWIADGVANKTVELDTNGNALSPSTGFTKSLFTATMRGATIDPTGNVWIGTNATTVDLIEEIVGAGVPVVTPLSAQLAAGKVAKP